MSVPRDSVPDQPAELAAARLLYVSDADPGITRRRAGRGFAYRSPDGGAVRDPATLARIRSLAIPPAYEKVWICTRPHGHLQATGFDKRGRKQYRYHPRWRQIRDEAKFSRLAAFGRALPALRRQCARDLETSGLGKPKVLAALVRLLETTLIRIGNEEYAASNGSFGLTTLRKRHADVSGARIRFEFRAKSGKQHRVGLQSRRLARIVRSCQELPGHRLFQYIDEAGELHPLSSDDVNAWLQAATGEEFTAKDFRTWAGTLLAAAVLAANPATGVKTVDQRRLTECIREVARILGNTPAVCRKCYIHPTVTEAWLSGALDPRLARPDATLADREALLLKLLD